MSEGNSYVASSWTGLILLAKTIYFSFTCGGKNIKYSAISDLSLS